MSTCCLVTGATGVVGSALVERLLRDEDTVVHLLIRADSDEHLQARVDELRSYWDGHVPESAGARLRAHRGDVCQSRLGLAEDEFERLARELTHVVHAAGNVKLNQPLEQARRSTGGALENVLELCGRGLEVGPFAKLEHLSTVGVMGRTPGVLPEERLTEPRQFHNTYERAKAEAEDRLFEEIDRGFPATIHRPSMVVGDSRTGRVLRRQVFYYLCDFLSGRRTMGFIPHLGNATLDTVPCDRVAEMIAASLHEPATLGRVVHECSGPDAAVRLVDLVRLAREELSRRGEPLPRLRTVSRRWFRRLLVAASLAAPPRTRRSLSTLPFFLDYLQEPQGYAVGCELAGAVLPPHDYLPLVLRDKNAPQLARR